MNQEEHRKRHIDQLAWRIAKLDGQSGILIQRRAELSPLNDFAKRQIIEHQIQMKIANIADLRGMLNEMTGIDSGELAACELDNVAAANDETK